MDDLTKFGIFAAIVLAILVGGLALHSTTVAPEAPSVAQVTETKETVVLPQLTLEMLDPIYSEKAVFEDDTIRISFKASQTKDGFESKVPFWLHNVSNEVITVLWDRCSMQLPAGNTVNIATEAQLDGVVWGPPSTPLSVAPCGDLFESLIPVTEVSWTDDSGWATSTGILDQAPFLVVFAIEKGGTCGAREIKHYTFRLVIR